ncbi:MAG: hypothetical protein KDA28_00750, partial [Phycisphaerales bacterium]|nr:hypothetical protein [Phycisphaerales bacterium]
MPFPAVRTLLFTLILLPVATVLGADDIIQVGKGSFTTVRPDACRPLPTTIHRAKGLDGPVPTTDWWTSLLWTTHSQPLFAHPLALRATPSGLTVTAPGDAIVATSRAIMGGAADGDLTISLSDAAPFPEARWAGSSDWFVDAEFGNDRTWLRTSFGHGSPFVYARHAGSAPLLRFAAAPDVWAGTMDDASIGITVRGRHYGLFGSEGSRWRPDDHGDWRLDTDRDHFSVALLPDRTPTTFEIFRDAAHRHVVGTRTEYEIEGNTVVTTFTFEIETLEGPSGGTLFALYPHQWKATAHDMHGGSYPSIRGELRLASGRAFTTRVPVQGVLPFLPVVEDADRSMVLDLLDRNPPGQLGAFKDTYWEGKDLGRLTTLAGIAESLGEHDLRDAYLDEIRGRLENWFTASGPEDVALFHYDERWGTLIGCPPSYGSDDQLNDHHFHAGYFIRAAAEVGRHDPAWARAWAPMVDLLVRDIASLERDDPMFPWLRCFDPYAGHAWASGHANFGDGNNQESSSESLNAWYGLVLWGEVTGNRRLRDL